MIVKRRVNLLIFVELEPVPFKGVFGFVDFLTGDRMAITDGPVAIAAQNRILIVG